MKVLLVTHHWKPYTHHSTSSGYQRLAWYLARTHEVRLLTWKKRGDTLPEDQAEDFPVSRVTTPASDVFLERRLLLSWYANRMADAYDVVHALYSVPALMPARKHPTVATVHVLPDIKPGLWTRYHGLLQRMAFQRVAHIIAVSTNLYAVLADRYGAERVSYIPHGVDIHAFRSDAVDAAEWRHRMLGDRYRSMAVMVGHHGVDATLIRRLALSHGETLFVIIGKPIADKTLPNVQFFSHISEREMIRIYQAADIFFRPLQFATANNALLEAMAMGKAIVVHGIPGVTDYLDTTSAYLAQDDEDFVVQFQRAVEDEDGRRDKGLCARLKAERCFSWEQVARQTTAVYESIR